MEVIGTFVGVVRAADNEVEVAVAVKIERCGMAQSPTERRPSHRALPKVMRSPVPIIAGAGRRSISSFTAQIEVKK